MKYLAAMTIMGCLMSSSGVQSQELERLTDELTYPWSLAFLPDGDLLITERPGQLRRLSFSSPTGSDEITPQLSEPLAGLPDIYTNAQAGLMDVQLDPDFAENQRIFISYACGTESANHTCLASALLSEDLTENRLEQVTEIFRASPAKQGGAHFGGRLAFLPDKTLVLTLGDGFDYREQAQNLGSHLGKTVRLQRDGSVPKDNPFVGVEGALPEIYTYGHRNVQGIVYDEENQRLYSHEHGPRGGDELNLLEPGENYGWPITTFGRDYTGAKVTPFTEQEGIVSPLHHWTPSIAPAGLTLHEERLWIAALAARQVVSVNLNPDEESALTITDETSHFEQMEQRWRDVRVGPDGWLYLLSDAEQGGLYRFKLTTAEAK